MSDVVTYFAAAILGATVVYFIGARRIRRMRRSVEDSKRALEECREGVQPSEFGTAPDAENIRFLYEQRRTLFNVRREHEWKIYFGAIFLLGAADTAIATGQVHLVGGQRCAWVVFCLVVVVAVLGFETCLQIGDDYDRQAMADLYNRLCDLVGIRKDTDSPVWERYTPREQRSAWLRFGWAFPWQTLLLLAVAAVSALLPYVDTVPPTGGSGP